MSGKSKEHYVKTKNYFKSHQSKFSIEINKKLVSSGNFHLKNDFNQSPEGFTMTDMPHKRIGSRLQEVCQW